MIREKMRENMRAFVRVCGIITMATPEVINVRKRYSLTIDPALMESVEERAEKEGLSKSRFVELALSLTLRYKRKAEMEKLAVEGYRLFAPESAKTAEAGISDWLALQRA